MLGGLRPLLGVHLREEADVIRVHDFVALVPTPGQHPQFAVAAPSVSLSRRAQFDGQVYVYILYLAVVDLAQVLVLAGQLHSISGLAMAHR